MKVLVCGSSGLVGNDLCLLLEKENIDYVGIYNSRPRKQSYKINIFDNKEILSFIEREKPTVCVNCIADRNVDICETNWESTKKLNVDIPNILAKICAEKQIFFVHISTDYVFDGRSSPYLPRSQVNPLQNYGITKLIAECRVKSVAPNSCIIRVPVLYTNTYTQLSETAVTVLGKKVMNRIERVDEDNYSIRRPLFIPDLCIFLLDCIGKKLRGTYHFYNPEDKTTKYEMCKSIGSFLQQPTEHILPMNDPPSNDASRPYDTQFLDTQYERETYPSTCVNAGISLCFKKYWHPKLFEPVFAKELFLLIDLDGTLIDTDRLHYECYKEILGTYNIDLSWETFAQFKVVDEGLKDLINDDTLLKTIRIAKKKLIQTTNNIQLIPGAEELISYCNEHSIQFVVVTNTGKETVEHFKQICPILQKVQNWITREDYTHPKPNSECFQLALQKFYTNQSYIIGIENTVSGYNALKDITSRIYIVTDSSHPTYRALKQCDCYLIKDLTYLNTRVA
jgi:S-adenosylmethionine synthetase